MRGKVSLTKRVNLTEWFHLFFWRLPYHLTLSLGWSWKLVIYTNDILGTWWNLLDAEVQWKKEVPLQKLNNVKPSLPSTHSLTHSTTLLTCLLLNDRLKNMNIFIFFDQRYCHYFYEVCTRLAIRCKIIPIPRGNYRDRILRFWRRNFLPWSEFLHAAIGWMRKTRSCHPNSHRPALPFLLKIHTNC